MTRTHNQSSNPPDASLNHFYEHGDIYDALGTLDDLRLVVARLKRQARLSAGELHLLGESLTVIEMVLSGKIPRGGPSAAGSTGDAPLLDA